MAIEIKCKLAGKLQVQNGSSARGAWCKQEFIVETIETYPRKICMNVWGDDKVAELSGYNVGESLIVSVNIESCLLPITVTAFLSLIICHLKSGKFSCNLLALF